MSNMQCSMSNMQCSMSDMQCSMSDMQCSMSNMQCSMRDMQCSMSKTYDDIRTNKMLKYDDTHTGCRNATSQKRA